MYTYILNKSLFIKTFKDIKNKAFKTLNWRKTEMKLINLTYCALKLTTARQLLKSMKKNKNEIETALSEAAWYCPSQFEDLKQLLREIHYGFYEKATKKATLSKIDKAEALIVKYYDITEAQVTADTKKFLKEHSAGDE